MNRGAGGGAGCARRKPANPGALAATGEVVPAPPDGVAVCCASLEVESDGRGGRMRRSATHPTTSAAPVIFHVVGRKRVPTGEDCEAGRRMDWMRALTLPGDASMAFSVR